MTTAILSSNPQVLVTQDNRILRIQFNRPERKNALSLAMYSALADNIQAANNDPGVRVLVLSGVNECFTSGNDLLDFMNDPKIRDDHPVVRFMTALRSCSKPVVAIVQGHAVGIGTTLLLHCDLVYAAEDARLQLPFVNLGLCPEYASSYMVPRLVGQQKAAELLLLGEPFNGIDAEKMGFVNAALPNNELIAFAETKIQRLASQPPAAVRRAKSLLKKTHQQGVEAALAAEFIGFAEGLNSDECKESVTAFFEKRAPNFSSFE
ncbi:MAG: enoyl-CoA hydratase [Gammaproteobacteria bacterium]|nr:MAG: enoyl-CoA hydratase [Gammaproteobacteria bacterium]